MYLKTVSDESENLPLQGSVNLDKQPAKIKVTKPKIFIYWLRLCLSHQPLLGRVERFSVMALRYLVQKYHSYVKSIPFTETNSLSMLANKQFTALFMCLLNKFTLAVAVEIWFWVFHSIIKDPFLDIHDSIMESESGNNGRCSIRLFRKILISTDIWQCACPLTFITDTSKLYGSNPFPELCLDHFTTHLKSRFAFVCNWFIFYGPLLNSQLFSTSALHSKVPCCKSQPWEEIFCLRVLLHFLSPYRYTLLSTVFQFIIH